MYNKGLNALRFLFLKKPHIYTLKANYAINIILATLNKHCSTYFWIFFFCF